MIKNGVFEIGLKQIRKLYIQLNLLSLKISYNSLLFLSHKKVSLNFPVKEAKILRIFKGNVIFGLKSVSSLFSDLYRHAITAFVRRRRQSLSYGKCI